LCINFSKQYDLPIKIARPFNNYGPGLKITDTRALPDFVKNILDGNDILLFSDGSPTRTFCYITDAIIGYYKVLINGVNGDYYNIGIDSPEISIKQLAEIAIENAKELFNYKGKLVYGESSDDDYLTDNPNRRCPDITKAKTIIGYNPKIDVHEGVKRSLIWYSENYKERHEE
jgi:nucleoside-diphosphate-sugar epimerase